MEILKTCTYLTILLSLLCASICSQVVLYNQNEDTDEDAISSLMEIDGLIRLPPEESSSQKQSPKYNNVSQNTNSWPLGNPSSPSSSSISSQSSSEPSSLSLSKSPSSSLSLSSYYDMGDQGGDGTELMERLEKERKAEEEADIDEWRLEEFYLPYEGEGSDVPLHRVRRQLTAGSGEDARDFSLTLENGPELTTEQERVDSPQNEALRQAIQDTLKTALSSSLNNGDLQIEVSRVSRGSIIVNGQILFPTDVLTATKVAEALDGIDEADNLKVDGSIYTVIAPYLTNDNGANQAAICYLCDGHQQCFQAADTTWFCKTVDDDYFPFGQTAGDLTLPKNDEFAEVMITINEGFPYQQEILTNLYITANGYISFGSSYKKFAPQELPVPNQKILAMYWSDLDLDNADEKSNIYYQLYTKTAENTPEQTAVFAKANAAVVEYISDVTAYDATHVIVTTYQNVPPFPALPNNNNERVNLQVAIVTDGQSTYFLLKYAEGGVTFNQNVARSVTIGYLSENLENALYYVFDQVVGNTGRRAYWVYELGKQPNTRTLCTNWFRQNFYLAAFIRFYNNRVSRCPCSEITAQRSALWLSSSSLSSAGTNCYIISQPFFGQFGRSCCYRAAGGAFENRIPLAGSFQLFTATEPFQNLNLVYDVAPKSWCCDNFSNLCTLYYFLRPQQRCRAARRRRNAWMFGEPHIKTLDERQYIFNGLGEYVLLAIDGTRPSYNTSTNFMFQARTCRAKNANGELTDATVWCAVAGRNTNGTSFFVSLLEGTDKLEVYINDEDFSNRFNEDPNFITVADLVTLSNVNGSVRINTPDDVGVTITKTGELLDFDFEIDVDFASMTTGLLGNFNGDKTDDFIFQNGTALPDTAKGQEIFQFGQSWAVTADNTVFRYPAGKGFSDYADPSFVPLFLDEVNATTRANAETVCGSPTALACIFDYVATQNEELARATQEGLNQFDRREEEMSNQAPQLVGDDEGIVLDVAVGQPTTFTVNATDADNEAITYVVLEGEVPQLTNKTESGVFIGTFTPSNLEPIQISVVAEDARGLQSEVQVITIRNCNCVNGTCNYNQTLNSSSVYYSIASCDCNIGYTGDLCDQEIDGCEFDPCPTRTSCKDATPEEQVATGNAYRCTDCPSGFTLANNDTKCDDVDECSSNSGPCDPNAQCTNNIGSFTCVCNPGFRTSQQQEHTCVDIDECIENSHECVQLCTNTVGGYTCGCNPGFTSFGPLQRNCSEVAAEDPCKDLTNDCQYGCSNESGVAQCYCQSGYSLDANAKTCSNINECEQRLCSQGCQDNDGSYTCSCYTGYILDDDKHGCKNCSGNTYGDGCLKTCECRGRGQCDKVRGCVCDPQWTGEFCTEDVNECLQLNICPQEQLCTNLNGSYTCTCPVGYTDTYSNGSCYDVDECTDPLVHNCPQNCRNNPGSFTCFCKVGFVYNSTGNTCDDFDECATTTSGCSQICVNKAGSFNCECNIGSVLGLDRKSCVTVEDVCANSDLSCEFQCTLVNDQPTCICPIGLTLATDSKSCLDINECASTDTHSCSDTCDNVRGSYNCSCAVGKELNADGRTCVECDKFHWGDNCANQCDCNPLGAVTCNRVTGCVCGTGWTGTKCETDRDECQSNTPICGTGEVCTNLPGSYDCTCATGYFKNATGLCEDINECETNRPCDQLCLNTVGSYICTCESGFKRDGDKCDDVNECKHPQTNTCEQLCRNIIGSFACECQTGYQLNTTNPSRNTCFPEAGTTECSTHTCDSCAVVNGQDVCSCRPGFEVGNDNKSCININECLLATNPCTGSGSDCADTDGSFVCTCTVAGYKLAADKVTCTACVTGTFGANCTGTCDCDDAHTQDCNSTTGECVCNNGWNGSRCDNDIDECSGSNPCGANSQCRDTPGSYECPCNVGFVPATNEVCQPCSSTTWGQDCTQTCTCIQENTVDCSDVDGTCSCQNGWTGNNCQTDKNECIENANYCPAAIEECNNIDGSAECVCVTGYTKIDNVCEDDNECLQGTDNCVSPKVCNNTIGSFGCVCGEGYLTASDGSCAATIRTFRVNFTLTFSSAIDESNLPNTLGTEIRDALFAFGRNLIQQALLQIVIDRLEVGSVIVVADVQINEQQSSDPDMDVSRFLHALVDGVYLQVGGENATVNHIDYSDTRYQRGASICNVYTGVIGGCNASQVCQTASNGFPQCVDESDDDNDDLIIGLSVGIPLFLILCIVIAVGIWLYMRDRRASSAHSTPSVDRDAPFRSMFARQMAPKGSWGAPQRFGMYSPDSFSEAGTSDDSGDNPMMKSRQKVRSDFQDSPWYSNQGATPRDITPREPGNGNESHSHGAPTETGAPTSNFSWEYMFRLLEPHRGFEIQRPNVRTSPNPTFQP